MTHNHAAVKRVAWAFTFFGIVLVIASTLVVSEGGSLEPGSVAVITVLAALGSAMVIGGIVAAVIATAIKPAPPAPPPTLDDYR